MSADAALATNPGGMNFSIAEGPAPGQPRAEFNLRQRIAWLRNELDEAERLLAQFYGWSGRDPLGDLHRGPLPPETPMRFLELSHRTGHVLRDHFGCQTLYDISALSRLALEKSPAIGRKMIDEIETLLRATGLRLAA